MQMMLDDDKFDGWSMVFVWKQTIRTPQIWWLMIMSMLKLPGTGLSSISRQTHGSKYVTIFHSILQNKAVCKSMGSTLQSWITICVGEPTIFSG